MRFIKKIKMRIFIYKAAIISILAIVVFKLTISSVIKFTKKIYENFNKEKIEYFKDKLRLEMKMRLKKMNILKKMMQF